MLPPDSPLRNPPDGLPPAQKVAVDGLRYAADMIGLSAERLHSSLLSVSTAPTAQPVDNGSFVVSLADAWSVIDDLWRFNILLKRMPGLKRTPDIEVHLRALKSVQALRNGFQHLDGEILACARNDLPLWGTLGWVYFPQGPSMPGKVFVMIPGALRPGNSPVPNPAGKQIAGPIDLVTLSAFGHQVDLTGLIRRVRALLTGLDQGFRRAVGEQQGGGADALISAEYIPSTSSRQAV